MPDQQYYFLSIPKTASTTLYYILVKQFGQDAVSPRQNLPDFLRNLHEKEDQYKVIAGHYYYNLRLILKREPIYISMFREPVDRVISNHAFVRRKRPDSPEAKQTLSQFISSEANYWKFRNLQTRYWGLNQDIPKVYEQVLSKEYSDREIIESLDKYTPNIDDSRMLTTAIDRLKIAGFVGVKEKFRESVELLHYAFKWKMPVSYQNWEVNHNPIRGIDDDTRRKIQHQNELDMELYEFVSRVFSWRLMEMRG